MARLLRNVTGDLRVTDSIIVGNLNLEAQDFRHRVGSSRCLFTGRVVLRHAHFHDVVELEDVSFAGDLDAVIRSLLTCLTASSLSWSLSC